MPGVVLGAALCCLPGATLGAIYDERRVSKEAVELEKEAHAREAAAQARRRRGVRSKLLEKLVSWPNFAAALMDMAMGAHASMPLRAGQLTTACLHHDVAHPSILQYTLLSEPIMLLRLMQDCNGFPRQCTVLHIR